MAKKDLVSVVIATHNSLRTIGRCLQSISKQSYKNIEIIVVDSKAYDPKLQHKAKKIIEKYARYFQDGPERSIQRNRGIAESKGKYVLIIDQDMYLSEHVVSECVQMMKADHQVSGILIPEISIGEGYWTAVVSFERYISNYLATSPNECCRFTTKTLFKKVDGFDENLVGAEDADFHHKIAQLGTIKKITAIIEHDEGHTHFWSRVKKKFYYSKAFRKYLEKHPELAVKQFFPFKKSYLTHLHILIAKPHLLLGIIVLRTCEVSAGILGICFKK